VSIDSIIDGAIGREGAYVNNPADPGGATIWGITERVARKHGYVGRMQDMPRNVAKDIYFAQYVTAPGFAPIVSISNRIAEEVIDTGINMGPAVSSIFLQTALNAFNNQAHDYPDLKVDGDIGPATIAALRAYLGKRSALGETVLLRALNSLQGARYLEIGANRPASEAFEFGWFANRVSVA
jgi:lysozyme family protein